MRGHRRLDRLLAWSSVLGSRQAGLAALAYLVVAVAVGLLRPVGGYDTAEADFYAAYAPQALRLLNGEACAWSRNGPGYSVLLAIGGAIGLDLFVTAKLLAALGVSVIGYATFVLGRELLCARAALCAELATYAALFRYGIQAGNDVPCAAFSLASLALLLRRESPSLRDATLAGLLAGCAAVTRYPSLALVLAALAGLMLWLVAGATLLARLRLAATYVLGFLVSSGPWWVWNTLENGSPLASKAYALVALDAYGSPGTQMSQSHLAEMEARFGSFAEVIRHDPAQLASRLPQNLYEDAAQFLADVVTLPIAVALGLGALVVAVHAGERWRRWLTLLTYATLAFLLVAIAPYQSRYYIPIAPVLFLVASASLIRGGPFEHARGWFRPIACSWALVAALFLAGTSAMLTAGVLRDSPRELIRAAGALRGRVQPADSIALRKPHLAFLAGAEPRFATEPFDVEPFFEWVRADATTRFVYVGPREIDTIPALAELLGGRAPPADFEIIDRSASPPALLLQRSARPSAGE